MYRVDLDLDRGEVKRLRQLALQRDLPVRGLVTKLAREAIQQAEEAENNQNQSQKTKTKKEEK